MQVEVTAHRIGGPPEQEAGPRAWKGIMQFPDAGEAWAGLYPVHGGPDDIRVEVSGITPATPEFIGFTVRLTTVTGQMVGIRPALLYTAVYDVPTYTAISNDWWGLFSLGFRRVS